MKKEYLTINSSCDGLPLSVAVFTPDNAKGIIQIAHGMAEHKERYYHFMEHMAGLGYASIINDHRGHGASVHSEEDLGHFYDEKAEYVVEDIHQLSLYMKERLPGKPLYLFGHSMGSLVVRKYIKKYDADIDKLIVCGSPSKNAAIGVALGLVKVQQVFKGDRHRSTMIQALAFGANNKNIENPISRTAWLSANEDNVREYDKNKLCGFRFTLNGFKNLFLLMKETYEAKGWGMKNPNLPIFFIAGAEDPIIVGEKQWKESQEFLKKQGYENVSGKLYEGMRHEILNEDIKEDVYQDIADFLG